MDVYRWFRWHHGSVSDPKMRMVAAKAETSVANVVAVWAALLEAASENADRGCIGEFDDDLCAFTLGIDVPILMRIKLAMRDRGMLIDDRVSAWDKRQPQREDATARERKARERERKAANSVTATSHAVSRDVTQQDASSQNVPPRGEEIREEKNRPPSPPSKSGKAKRTAPSRAAPLPDGFALDDGMRAYAEQKCPGVDAAAEFERFCEHHRSHANQFKDWTAAWRKWAASPFPKAMKSQGQRPKVSQGYGFGLL